MNIKDQIELIDNQTKQLQELREELEWSMEVIDDVKNMLDKFDKVEILYYLIDRFEGETNLLKELDDVKEYARDYLDMYDSDDIADANEYDRNKNSYYGLSDSWAN